MALSLPNGSTIGLASGYGTAAPITALTNATEAVATATNTFTAGDYVEITSGWSRLNNKIVRVKAATGTTFTLEGYDTSNTSIYPAGSGIGSARKVSGFTQLSQVLSSSSSGGDQQFLEVQYLESDAQIRIPTVKNAAGLTLSIADDPSLAGYQLASAANDDRLPRAMLITTAAGSKIAYNAYVSLNKIPSLTVNQAMACELTLSFLSEPVRYVA